MDLIIMNTFLIGLMITFLFFVLYLIVKKAVYRGLLEALETLERKDNFIDTNED